MIRQLIIAGGLCAVGSVVQQATADTGNQVSRRPAGDRSVHDLPGQWAEPVSNAWQNTVVQSAPLNSQPDSPPSLVWDLPINPPAEQKELQIERPDRVTIAQPNQNVIHQPQALVIHQPQALVINPPQASETSPPQALVINQPQALVINQPPALESNQPQALETRPPPRPKIEASTGAPPESESLIWWNHSVSQPILHRPDWVAFDLETVLLDTLRHSPRIKGVTHQASSALERIVQQDAAFDSNVLFSGTGGRTNDPVGNTLTTGGPDRLRDETTSVRGGITRNGRRGTQVGLTQQLGIKSSNSTFFVPGNQGDARLSLSLTQPLLARGGQVYNERLLTQARIDSRVTWQEMRGDVQRRIADVMTTYWKLYEVRCHLLQQQQLLSRSKRIQATIIGRNGFDGSRIELAKANQRIARRTDRLVILDADVLKRQTRLATLIGADELAGASTRLELIPQETPVFPDQQWELRDVLVQTIENRPEVRAATSELESAALAIRVTRSELVPQLNAVINASLASLNGQNRFGQSFLDQFSGIDPGFSAGLQYEMPFGRRAARSRVREAQYQYRQRAEALRETIQETQWEAESALIDLQRTSRQLETKRNVLTAAIEEERVLTRRWEMMGSEGGRAGTVLETLLDAQQRRTDAEREYVSAQTEYMTALIALQQSMGTLLRYEGIDAIRAGGDIQFTKQNTAEETSVVPPTPDVTLSESNNTTTGTTATNNTTTGTTAMGTTATGTEYQQRRVPSYARMTLPPADDSPTTTPRTRLAAQESFHEKAKR